ncbi:hypothetical protein CANCADRAFT_43511 [Tortispora caseinolytica NRRL Y-17796]|uniref:Uncharacterized protein n=1 Tax=Tortispora caseinolytica NRRL Y-17796 TaxID=767744 RepID=A0A1E4TME6_9ASCO|nr:hypothetical protein CANCADRAFT_43511 [Tortispora caseinolytica NRRL Y-17796]
MTTIRYKVDDLKLLRNSPLVEKPSGLYTIDISTPAPRKKKQADITNQRRPKAIETEKRHGRGDNLNRKESNNKRVEDMDTEEEPEWMMESAETLQRPMQFFSHEGMTDEFEQWKAEKRKAGGLLTSNDSQQASYDDHTQSVEDNSFLSGSQFNQLNLAENTSFGNQYAMHDSHGLQNTALPQHSADYYNDSREYAHDAYSVQYPTRPDNPQYTNPNTYSYQSQMQYNSSALQSPPAALNGPPPGLHPPDMSSPPGISSRIYNPEHYSSSSSPRPMVSAPRGFSAAPPGLYAAPPGLGAAPSGTSQQSFPTVQPVQQNIPPPGDSDPERNRQNLNKLLNMLSGGNAPAGSVPSPQTSSHPPPGLHQSAPPEPRQEYIPPIPKKQSDDDSKRAFLLSLMNQDGAKNTPPSQSPGSSAYVQRSEQNVPSYASKHSAGY